MNERWVAVGAWIQLCIASTALADDYFSAAVRADLERSSFVVYGDMPYRSEDSRTMTRDLLPWLREVNQAPFVVHVGDIGRPDVQSAYNSCSSVFRSSTLSEWYGLERAVFYTPGDNDWTDCDRVGAVPLTMLSRVRAMYTDPRMRAEERHVYEVSDLPEDFPLHQVGTPENQMWESGGVLYASLHVVGSNNGWVASSPARQQEVNRRDQANLTWLERVQDRLFYGGVNAVVIVMHVDLFADSTNHARTFETCKNDPRYGAYCNGLDELARYLQDEEASMPLLLVHGDTNAHCLDQPIPGRSNFWRLNAPGDFKLIDVDIVRVDAASRSQPFQVRRLFARDKPPAKCDYSL